MEFKSIIFIIIIVVLFNNYCFYTNSSAKLINQLHNPSDDRQKFMKDMYPELFSELYQGDILLIENPEKSRNALRDDRYRWPNGIIPYEIHSNFNETEKEKVMSAIKRLTSETCIKFEEHKNETQYATIYKEKGAGCFSVIGYHSEANTTHPVNLESPGCLKHQGTIEHELLHLIGLFHEQSRADRDKHVLIYWGNITEGTEFNFKKVSDDEAATYDLPYDYASVMHYPRFAFSKNGQDTIVCRNNTKQEMGQRKGATEDDLKKVRKMYKCDKKPESDPAEWFINKMQNIFKRPAY